eukprot:scaffold74006_cov53-Attheya_sp.AAC.1
MADAWPMTAMTDSIFNLTDGHRYKKSNASKRRHASSRIRQISSEREDTMASAFGNTPGMHLQDLILDAKHTATNEQKADCLKLLRVVIKNLADPARCTDAKYRQLRLSNEKVQAKLLPCPSAVDYMMAIGFAKITDIDGAAYLRIPVETTVNPSHMAAALQELTNAIVMVEPSSAASASASSTSRSLMHSQSSSFGEEKKTPEGIIIKSAGSSSSGSGSGSSSFGVVPSRFTEKQKARDLMEKKRTAEAQDAKRMRALNVAKLKQDKFVRENDENWKSGVSAACAKSGTGISTFRDKYGEGEN